LVARVAGSPPHSEMPGNPELYLTGELIDFGMEMVVSLGPSDSARRVFRGFVSAIEVVYAEGREPEVVIFAEDSLMKLRTTRRFRSYENTTDVGIAEEIASEHGLAVQASADGPTYDVVQQWNQS